MDLGLTGRKAFVAGASSGLGFAVASVLAQEGCRVAICSRNKERITTAAERIRKEYGIEEGHVLPLICDVTDEDQVAQAIEVAATTFGGLNILVTNAGGPPAGFIGDFATHDWQRALNLSLLSTINMCRYALPFLREAVRGDDPLGRILMITSVSAKQPVPNLYLSNVARAGVQGFAKSLSEELGPEGITVNTILPGYTNTERLSQLAEAAHQRTGKPIEEIHAGWAEASALKRIGQPMEFASAAAFLVSARASYITGVAFPVDGGRIKHLL